MACQPGLAKGRRRGRTYTGPGMRAGLPACRVTCARACASARRQQCERGRQLRVRARLALLRCRTALALPVGKGMAGPA